MAFKGVLTFEYPSIPYCCTVQCTLVVLRFKDGGVGRNFSKPGIKRLYTLNVQFSYLSTSIV